MCHNVLIIDVTTLSICEENVITQNAVKTSMNLAVMQYKIWSLPAVELSTVSFLMTDIKIIHE